LISNKADGKLPSIWDTATHKVPSIIKDGSTGDEAGKSYEFFMKDVEALKYIGV
jgi:beta-glucosidase/6-phospho-beta-glucosidase/beta-galactosidase